MSNRDRVREQFCITAVLSLALTNRANARERLQHVVENTRSDRVREAAVWKLQGLQSH